MGWGYLDHFVGDQLIPGGKTIGTTSWEAPGDLKGFAPFKSIYKQGAYGAYLARPCVLRVLIGTLDYGKGKIILSPAYPVDDDNAFCDLLFFNMILMGNRGNGRANISTNHHPMTSINLQQPDRVPADLHNFQQAAYATGLPMSEAFRAGELPAGAMFNSSRDLPVAQKCDRIARSAIVESSRHNRLRWLSVPTKLS